MISRIKRRFNKKHVKEILKKEKEFKFKDGSGRIKYVFQENPDSDKLLIVFSGFGPVGKPPVYNYLLSFKDLECNKLYILDDFGIEAGGSYYLGNNGDWFLVNEIPNLISYIKEVTGIEDKNITLTGSSKGGFAALFYGIKNGYGSVIAGEPQVLVGEYLSSVPAHVPILEDIMGVYSKANIEKLNRSLLDVVEKATHFPNNIQILCGENNTYYLDGHIRHLTNLLDEKDVGYD